MIEQNENLKRETETLCALTFVLMNALIACALGGALRLIYQISTASGFYDLFAGKFLIQ